MAAAKPKIIGNSIADGNQEKHNALMDEFKKAHRKMFKNGFCNENSSSNELNENQVRNGNIGFVCYRFAVILLPNISRIFG